MLRLSSIACSPVLLLLSTLLLTTLLTSCESPIPQQTPAEAAASGHRVLLVSGQNNHAWEETNQFLQAIVGETGLFDLSVSLTPPKGSDSTAWDNWRPDFAAYDVILMDYNGEMWPDAVKSAFEQYISGGGTALMVHASNNPFPGWTAYEQMVGLLWRRPDAGIQVYMNAAGELVRNGPDEGRRSGHGKLHDWQIQTRDAEHPIMKGLPQVWLHPHDELYHGQRGPAENMNILATAFSSPDHGGTGEHELMVWWIPFGQGKVLTMLPGHHWPDQEDERAYRCVGFRTLVNRGLEWLATGSVTQPVPADFPTAETISLR